MKALRILIGGVVMRALAAVIAAADSRPRLYDRPYRSI